MLTDKTLDRIAFNCATKAISGAINEVEKATKRGDLKAGDWATNVETIMSALPSVILEQNSARHRNHGECGKEAAAGQETTGNGINGGVGYE